MLKATAHSTGGPGRRMAFRTARAKADFGVHPEGGMVGDGAEEASFMELARSLF